MYIERGSFPIFSKLIFKIFDSIVSEIRMENAHHVYNSIIIQLECKRCEFIRQSKLR